MQGRSAGGSAALDVQVLDLEPLLDRVRALVLSHRLGTHGTHGAYRRFTRSTDAAPRSVDIDPYGCADAANLLYTLDALPREPAERERFVATLRGLQDEADGLFHESTHHAIHTTAHCVAALELFDAGPAHPLAGLHPYRDPRAMEAFLDGLDWAGNPWTASHQGAGLYAALHLAREVGPDWEERYFAWIARETDPVSGMLRRGALAPGPAGDPMRFPALAGTFHYLFNQQHARRPHPHPEALVDTCLDIRRRALFPFHSFVGFAEVDWVYCLNRASRQSGHRLPEARAALRDFAATHVRWLEGLDPATDPHLDDLHAVFGTVCCLAELQQALPGELSSARPLRLVLDRRPFI